MTDGHTRVEKAAGFIARRVAGVPAIAVVLGSGLSAFASRLADPVSIGYEDIPHWPTATIVGHEGRLVAGRIAGRQVLVLSGRSHLYEGRPIADVVFGVRVIGRLGVPAVILTNAAGGINPRFRPGALMIIDDHISLLGPNPLVGPNRASDGQRFPDMSAVYSPRLRSILMEVARARRIAMERGVYVAVSGPSYETPAEIRALRALGADAVGMSTVPEAIVARQMGLEVLGLSVISNRAAGMSSSPVSSDEVIATTARARDALQALLEGVIEKVSD